MGRDALSQHMSYAYLLLLSLVNRWTSSKAMYLFNDSCQKPASNSPDNVKEIWNHRRRSKKRAERIDCKRVRV